MAAARELVIADEPAAWAALGFATGADGSVALGGLKVRPAGAAAGRGIVELRADGLAAERPDGLPVVEVGGGSPAHAAPHPNGALAIDHVVVFTDDRDRTTAALEAAGGDVRRRGEPPELPAPMAFVRFGALLGPDDHGPGRRRPFGSAARGAAGCGSARPPYRHGPARRRALGRARVHHPALKRVRTRFGRR